MNTNTNKLIALCVFAATLLTGACSARAESVLKLAAPFGDAMVLQQGMAMPVWGEAEPGARVKVSFAGQTRTAVAASNGQWRVTLKALRASSENRVMHIESGTNKLDIIDVLVGEVWLCSGQSNMELGVGNSINGPAEIAAANHPNIRLRQTPKVTAPVPRATMDTAPWLVCNPVTIKVGPWYGCFSAVGYYFARSVHRETKVPVGMIQAAWYGTPIQPWINPEAYRRDPKYKMISDFLDKSEASAISPPNPSMPGQPTCIYNAMIAPWAGFPIRGVIWYQGETNIIMNNEASYWEMMYTLVDCWRKAWNRTDADFPFYFVQIAPFGPWSGGMPAFWAQQSNVERKVPNVGMALTQDTVDKKQLDDIHASNKHVIGMRLARLALSRTYGVKSQEGAVIRDDCGPTFKALEVKGSTLEVTFDHVKSGLIAREGKQLSQFEIAGTNHVFSVAQAKIAGNKVILQSATVPSPTEMRFAWSPANQADIELLNGDQLPAMTFCAPQP